MRLWSKILLATGVVIAISLVVAGVLSGLLIRRNFNRFVRTQERDALERVAPALVTYYEQNGSWAGLERFLGARPGQLMGPAAGMRVLLVDPQRQVLIDTKGERTGEVVPESVWESGVPIVVQGEEVGRLVGAGGLSQARRASSLLEQNFLNSMTWALLGASFVGAFAAIIVATIVALQITAPARALTRAARRIAAGELEHRVAVRSEDELGEVGTAFNEMASTLAHQEELRRHMVADIAHELRTPLAVMQVELTSLQDSLADPTPEVIASLSEEVGLLSRLVEDLSLLSLMDAGQLSLRPEPVELTDVIQNAVQQVTAAAEQKGILLEATVPPDLPPAQADPDRLQQVLLNLLSNALRHTPAGGQVRLSARFEEAELHLQVVDTGEGITPEDLPHIFDRFYRADASRSRATGGSGLGLTIARGLVEAMGGRIWAGSTPGEGTTIHFTLLRV